MLHYKDKILYYNEKHHDFFSVRLDVDSKISENLEMSFLTCRAHDKMATFLYLVRKIMQTTDEQTIVFCATMKHVEHLVAILEQAGIEASYLFSQLDAGARNINIMKYVRLHFYFQNDTCYSACEA